MWAYTADDVSGWHVLDRPPRCESLTPDEPRSSGRPKGKIAPPPQRGTRTSRQRHETLAGEVLEYPAPAPELTAFLSRLRVAADDPHVSEVALAEFLYSLENPLLARNALVGRGAVTLETYADPTYHLMLDLLDRKRVQQRELRPDGDRYTMSVTEAAAELGISRTAVQKAIDVGHLDAVRRGRAYLIDPASVATYRRRVVRRGPRARKGR